MKESYIVFCLLLISVFVFGQSSLNVDLVKIMDRGAEYYSGSWVYVDGQGREYGLVGAKSGVAIYSLEAGQDEELAFIPGPFNNWREITVIKDHAYITTEGRGDDEGLQVLSLAGLPDTAFLLTTYDSTFTTGHILQKDVYKPDEPYIYISGTDATGGVHILDVSNPADPVEVGLHNPGDYVHDVHVRGDRMYTFQFNIGVIQVVDISDKTNPVLLASIDDPGGATHSGWTTDDNNFLLVADERNGFVGRIFDIRDLENIFEVSTFTSNPNTFVHNPYVSGDFAYLAHNREGLRVYDVVDPSNPVEIGYYDTVTDENAGSGGLWSACPFIPSKKVIGGDRDLGLMVWEINEVYASRFSGTVFDENTLLPLNDVNVSIVEQLDTTFTDGFGDFKGGYPIEGKINLKFALDGYASKTVEISLVAGEEQVIEVYLEQASVGTKQLIANDRLKVWPTPTDENLLVSISENAKGDLSIFNLLGQNVKTVVVNETGKMAIDVIDLSDGIYFLRWRSEDQSTIASQRVIIKH